MIEDILQSLHERGLTLTTIVPGSSKIGTSFKSYCQFATWPSFGILFSHEIGNDADEHPRSMDEIKQRLHTEARYLKEFSDQGAL